MADRTWNAVELDGARGQLQGYVCGGGPAIAAAWRSRDFAALEGSFLLQVTDGGGTTYVTDRTASVKAYLHRSTDAADQVTTDPAPEGRADLDLGTIGNILVNGYALAGRTLHEGSTALLPGTVTRLAADGTTSTQRYWRFEPNPDPGLGREEAKALLADALVSAVDRHVRGPVRLSLSAGYDARGLLGILREKLGKDDVATFSYAHGTPAAGSDAFLAAQLAKKVGCAHEVVESVGPSVVAAITENAELGRGVANFCDEVEVWTRGVPRDLPVVVGDESFGWSGDELGTDAQLLEAVYLHDSGGIRALRSLGLPRFEELRARTDEVVAQTLAPHLGLPDRHAAKDSLYFAERLCQGLMTWRDSFAGDGRQVVNPLLDGQVLGVVARLAQPDRLDKALFREVIRELVPGVFEVPFATSMGYSPDWRALLVGNGPALLETLAQPSRLDEVIAPEAIERLLARCSSRGTQWRAAKSRVGASLRYRGRPWSAPGRLLRWEIGDADVLRRILVLRAALAPRPV